ncbi:unnamed protein product [Diatraea saccharalis]|uniref:Gag-like protein n=1 Tax=Diatraea saccharalis TaxID=40085 RepID=A0A9N9RAS5_9NEOP|nr:unnamed protein product [Diatraea saccharalis]
MIRSPKPTQRQTTSQIPTPSPRMSLDSIPKTPPSQKGTGPQEWGPDMDRFWEDLTTITNRIAKAIDVLETQPTLRKDTKEKLITTLKKTKEKTKKMESTAEEIRSYIEQQEIRFSGMQRDLQEIKKEGNIMEKIDGIEIGMKKLQEEQMDKMKSVMKEWEMKWEMENRERHTRADIRHIEHTITMDPIEVFKRIENMEDNITAEIIDMGRRVGEKSEDNENSIKQIIEEKTKELKNEINKCSNGGTDYKHNTPILERLADTEEYLNGRITHAREEVIAEMKQQIEAVKYKSEKENPEAEYTGTKKTYAEAIRDSKNKIPKTLHSIIVSSSNQLDTSEEVLNKAKEKIEAKKEGLRIDRIRKCKDARIIIGCETIEQINKIEDKLKYSKGLKVEKIKNKDPLVILKDVYNDIGDEEILQAIKEQNSNIFQDLIEDDKIMRIKFKKSTKNKNATHVALQVRPALWQRMTGAGYLHVDLQRVRVEDQSPVVQCTKCLEFGHGRKFCTAGADRCSHCGGPHLRTECPDREEKPPRCCNCSRSELQNTAHNAFSKECPTRAKWDFLARATTAYS